MNSLQYNPVILNLNTERKSWWYTNSISCDKHIQHEYDQHQYREKLDKIKLFYESSSLSQKNDSNATSNSNYARVLSDDSFLTDAESSPIYEDSFAYDNQLRNRNYTYLENFVRTNCLLPFYYIEIMHSSILIVLGVTVEPKFSRLLFRLFSKTLTQLFITFLTDILHNIWSSTIECFQ